MNEEKKLRKSKGGRIPKEDPANIRHVFYLNEVDQAKFYPCLNNQVIG